MRLGWLTVSLCSLIVTLMSGAGSAAAMQKAASPGGRRAACPAAGRPVNPVPALTFAAHPLATTAAHGPFTDLAPLGRMVGNARVVGVGEATHGSHQFFTLKDRIFRYLVKVKGFRTFALEADWRSGLRIDSYVLHGRGDIRRIMRQEFQSSERLYNVREYLQLFRWMRAYDRRHPGRVQFMGDDVELASPAMFATVTSYARRHYPWLSGRLAWLYRGQVPTLPVGAAIRQYMRRPLGERQDMAARAGRAYTLLRRQRPAAPRERFAWVLQQARVIAQVAGFWSFDFASARGHRRMDLFRDRAMAANVVWWHRHMRSKIVLSAHNTHIAYFANDPADYPRPQGAFLRDQLGPGYVNIFTTFDAGSFKAFDYDSSRLRSFTVGPAPAGSNEKTLAKVPYRDYVLDMRTVPCSARQWLETSRPTWDIGKSYSATWPVRYAQTGTPLRPSADILILVRRVDAAQALPGVS